MGGVELYSHNDKYKSSFFQSLVTVIDEFRCCQAKTRIIRRLTQVVCLVIILLKLGSPYKPIVGIQTGGIGN